MNAHAGIGGRIRSATIAELTSAQLNASLAKNNASMMRLDKQLEHAIGGKERAFGAQHHHAREHGKFLYNDKEK